MGKKYVLAQKGREVGEISANDGKIQLNENYKEKINKNTTRRNIKRNRNISKIVAIISFPPQHTVNGNESERKNLDSTNTRSRTQYTRRNPVNSEKCLQAN